MRLTRNPSPLLARLIAVVLSAAVLSGAAVTLAVASPARAADTDGISGAPAGADGADGRSRLSYQAAPGQHLDDYYLVRNTGTTAQTMRVFATDAYNTDNGAYGLLDTDVKPSDSGDWVAFAGGAKQLSIPLEPGGSQLVPFTVDVPADAAPGDHAAGIVISVTSAQGQILVDRRVATRLYVRVPGELQPSLTISSIASSYQAQLNPFSGSTTLTFTVKNNGNVALAANMIVGVRSFFGIAAAPLVRQELSEMLPRSTRVVSVVVPGVAQLGYLNPYVSMVPTVDRDALNPGPLHVVERDTVVVAVPWWLVVLIVLALAFWLFLRLRSRNEVKNTAAWAAYSEAEARRKLIEEGELVGTATVRGEFSADLPDDGR